MQQNHKTVFVVGLGPGGAQFLTAQAQSALDQAEVLCGYTVYLDLIRPLYPEKETYATGMTKELDRCRWALETAQAEAFSSATEVYLLNHLEHGFETLNFYRSVASSAERAVTKDRGGSQ